MRSIVASLISLSQKGLPFAVLVALFFTFQNCGMIRQPSLDSMQLASVGYIHSGVERACATCHEKDRPAPSANKTPHGAGADCIGCHRTTRWNDVTGFSHTPTPTHCIDCHLAERPTGLSGVKKFDHAKGGLGDCVACHAAKAGSTWAGGQYNHTPTPTECSSCHASERPVGPSGIKKFDHSKGGMGDCAACHKSPGVTWAGGQYNHTPTPTACLSCHLSDRPVGPAGNPPFDHAKGGTGDCVSCHKSPGVTWAGGQYSHSPAPTECMSCHVGDRPVGPVGNPPFNHANGGMGDCVSCHKRPGVTWAGGLFSHSPVPTSCNSCHSSNRPTIARYPNNTTVSGHYNAKDCYACHMPQSTTVTTFRFNHSNALNQNIRFCLPCHLSDGQDKHRNDPDVIFSGDGNCYNCHTQRRSFND